MSSQDFIQTEDNRYYIHTRSSYLDDQVKVLNHGYTFGVFNRWGDIQPVGSELQGIYYRDTRFLSDFELRISGRRPILLSSSIKEDNAILHVDLTNPDLQTDQGFIPTGVLHFERSKFIHGKISYDTIIIRNFSDDEYKSELSFTVDADFKDIFEIRGTERKQRGNTLDPETRDKDSIILRYQGLDDILRCTEVKFTPTPDSIAVKTAKYQIKIKPQEIFRIQIVTTFNIGAQNPVKPDKVQDLQLINAELQDMEGKFATVFTANEQFNHWINRSRLDLISLIGTTPNGPYPFAGVPWYNTPFGRDGIITAYETLWLAPSITKGVLMYLAATQAREENAFQDAEPGKIFHETRGGEMAELGEIPFKLYYGTVDATPLFVMLAGAYFKRTADLDTIRSIWPNIEAALNWMEVCGDINGDGFLRYSQKSISGLRNQGWKDSSDAISHEDGRLAELPIALCEVQGYVYDARLKAAMMARVLGHTEIAVLQEEKARLLKENFQRQFWDKELGTYVLALDGAGRPCRVKSSNAGHLLFSGIVDPASAKILAKTLLAPEMFTGWGIRTLASDAVRYNPISYHNGSVWPHDSALAALGLARYGFRDESLQIMRGLFDATLFLEWQRMPELFCGFERRDGAGPTSYPAACSPQAWSVAAVFILIQAALNIEIDALNKQVMLSQPILPDYLETIQIRNLELGTETCEIDFDRGQYDVGIHIKKKPDDWDILVRK